MCYNETKTVEKGGTQMKRYWVFSSAEYEGSLGMGDLIDTFDAKVDAVEFIDDNKFEWAAIFDSKLGMQIDKQWENWFQWEKIPEWK